MALEAPFLVPINLNQLELRNPVIHLLTTDPTPVAGQLWFNTTTHVLKYYDGTTVQIITPESLALLLGSAAGGDLTGTYPNPTLAGTANVESIIRANRLDQFAAPTATVSFNGQTVTGLANATNPTDAVNLTTLQAMMGQTEAKEPVAYATTAALPANTYAGGVLTATANGALSVDGVPVVAGQSILVKNEATAANNGIYTVTNAGAAGAAYVLTRRTDSSVSADWTAGDLVPVEAPTGSTAGTSNNGVVFITLTASPFVLGTSGMNFTSIGSTYTAGTGLTLTGTQFALTTPVSTANGGTGAASPSGAKTSLGFTTKYVQTIGDGTTTSFPLTHGLGSSDVVAQCYLVATGQVVQANIVNGSSTQTTISFAVAPAANSIRVVIIG